MAMFGGIRSPIPTLARQSSTRSESGQGTALWRKLRFPRTPAGLRLLTCIDAEGRTDVAGSRDAREPLGRAPIPDAGSRAGVAGPREAREPLPEASSRAEIAEAVGYRSELARPEISLVSKPGVVERFLLHSRPRDDKLFLTLVLGARPRKLKAPGWEPGASLRGAGDRLGPVAGDAML